MGNGVRQVRVQGSAGSRISILQPEPRLRREASRQFSRAHPHHSSANATKAHAVTWLRDRLEADKVIVFGDNLNVLPMSTVADESYAVANAVPEVIAAATAAIGSSAVTGVAQWLTCGSVRGTSNVETA